jgi:GT2 family glycosyltransferase
MTPSPIKFSVVIPAFERPEQLAQCLARLAPGTQTHPAADYEVIVTDDSRDSSVRDLVQKQFSWAKWTAGPRKGPAANRNHGAEQAGHAWIVFTDDDCLPDAGWLAAFAEVIATASPGAAPDVLEGRTYADRPRQSLAERSPINSNGGYLWSCNFAIQTDCFRRLGGFDTGFPYASMEDVDFARRLRAAGAREQFVPAAGVCHPWRDLGGFRGMWIAEKKHFASVKYFLAKNPEARALHTPAAYLKMNARQLVRETLPGWWRWRGRGFSAALAWHLYTLRSTFALMKTPASHSAKPV